MADRFTCSICGREHEGLVTDWAYRLPDAVWALPEAERAAEASFTGDLCVWGDRRFIRCLLDLPFTDAPGQFGWGAWAEVDRTTYDRYVALYDEDGSAEPAHAGRLANALPPYQGSFGEPVAIRFRDASNRPLLHLPADDASLLARDQRDGIDTARHHAILSVLGHR